MPFSSDPHFLNKTNMYFMERFGMEWNGFAQLVSIVIVEMQHLKGLIMSISQNLRRVEKVGASVKHSTDRLPKPAGYLQSST